MCTSPSCEEKAVLKKGAWTPEEDQKLVAYIQRHGHKNWRELPSQAGLERCGRSCRLRWINYLRPDIKRGNFSLEEERTIIQLHALFGNRWSAIAAQLPRRTDNEIKNYWNTHLKKRLIRMGIDPTTHKPVTQVLYSTGSSLISHMAQWETARLEAEARLRESNHHLGSSSSQHLAQPFLNPSQDSWSCPLTSNERNNTEMYYDMYALMLDDHVSTSSFPEKGENLLTSPVTLPKPSDISGISESVNKVMNMEDDDIMVAVKAFMHVSK